MIRILPICLLFLIIGCAGQYDSLARSQPRSPLKHSYIAPSKKIQLTFKLGDPSIYQLVDTASGAVVATAQSAITPDDVYQNAFRGTVDVVFSSNSKSLCIQEGVSDASPATRYILIRPDSESSYEVRYLLPEYNMIKTDPGAEFQFAQPDVVGLSQDAILMRYSGVKTSMAVWLDSIHFTTIPRTSN
jgi:hypothetical protein